MEQIGLRDFLRKRTKAKELCVIRVCGWISSTCWIDDEDRFRVPPRYADELVKNHEWGYLSVVNENGVEIKIPCHYIDL